MVMSEKHKQEEAAFKDAYASLNAAQKEAVDTIEGPVMVIAGPGTGKTQILTLRIANILMKTDTAPEQILALTFTESGQQAMRKRLRLYIGERAYKVPIFTFHSFAERLIKEHPDSFPNIIGSRTLSDLESVLAMEQLLSSLPVKKLRPVGDPNYHVKSILNAIRTMKREYKDPDAFAVYISKREIALQEIPKIHEKGAHKGKVRGEYKKTEDSLIKDQELLLVYRAYESWLRTERKYDYEDMIVEAVRALEKDENLLLELQENYQYILADEHQDVNGSQNRILELLANYHSEPNIFVVGDEKQAIYRFQGASLENFLYFEDKFVGTKTISLTLNYRSGQKILDTAHSLIAVEEGPLKNLRVPLESGTNKIDQICLSNFSHQAIEDNSVCTTIKDLIKKGTSPSEMVVILRTNHEVEEFAAALRREGINVNASAEGDILTHPLTTTVLNLIEAIVSPESDPALFVLLHGSYWDIEPSDLFKLCGARNGRQSLSKILTNTEILNTLELEAPEKVKALTDTLKNIRARLEIDSPNQLLAKALTESGLLEHVLKEDIKESTRVIRRIYDEVERLVVENKEASLRDISKMMKSYKEHGIALVAPYISAGEETVNVMTAHKAKGLEFEQVFIPHLVDSTWGGKKARNNFYLPIIEHTSDGVFDDDDDERRLFYVALTRAKLGLHLSGSETNSDGRTFNISRFLAEVDDSLLEEVNVEKFENQFNPAAALKVSYSPVISVETVRDLFKERGLSATSLNNYLESPWNYIYRNLLRVPEEQSLSLIYGNAIHNTLEKVTREHTKLGELPTMSEVTKLLEKELSNMPLSVDNYTKLHQQGIEELAVYLEHVESTITKVTKEEFSLRVVMPTDDADLPEVVLTGKLDRLDFNDEGQLLRVADYKTGRPKTRGEIEGSTKNSNGDYKRQLVFYALLLELYGDERYFCREGVLSFVRADKNSEIREEVFIITDTEVADLRKEIIRVAKEIVSGECLLEPCDAEVCNYCHLAEQLQG